MSQDRKAEEQKEVSKERAKVIIALLDAALNDKTVNSFFLNKRGRDADTIKPIRSALEKLKKDISSALKQPDRKAALEHIEGLQKETLKVIVTLCEKTKAKKDAPQPDDPKSINRHALYEAIIQQDPLLISEALGYQQTVKKPHMEKAFGANSKLVNLAKDATFYKYHEETENLKKLVLLQESTGSIDQMDRDEAIKKLEMLFKIIDEAKKNPDKKHYIDPENLEVIQQFPKFLLYAGVKINETSTSFTVREINNLFDANAFIENAKKFYTAKKSESKVEIKESKESKDTLYNNIFHYIKTFESIKSQQPNPSQSEFYKTLGPYFDFILAQSRDYKLDNKVATDLNKLFKALFSFETLTQLIIENLSKLTPDKVIPLKLKTAFETANDAIKNRGYTTNQRMDKLDEATKLVTNYLNSFSSTSNDILQTTYEGILKQYQERNKSSPYAESKLAATVAPVTGTEHIKKEPEPQDTKENKGQVESKEPSQLSTLEVKESKENKDQAESKKSSQPTPEVKETKAQTIKFFKEKPVELKESDIKKIIQCFDQMATFMETYKVKHNKGDGDLYRKEYRKHHYNEYNIYSPSDPKGFLELFLKLSGDYKAIKKLSKDENALVTHVKKYIQISEYTRQEQLENKGLGGLKVYKKQ